MGKTKTKTPPPPRRLLSREEAAEFLGVSCGTLSRWAADRSGPAFVKLGDGEKAGVRYPVDALESFVESRTCRPK